MTFQGEQYLFGKFGLYLFGQKNEEKEIFDIMCEKRKNKLLFSSCSRTRAGKLYFYGGP